MTFPRLIPLAVLILAGLAFPPSARSDQAANDRFPDPDWPVAPDVISVGTSPEKLAAAKARDLAVDVTVLPSDSHTKSSLGVAQRPKVVLGAAQAARDAGAAGYNFHTRACFDLRAGTLFEQLDPEEKKAVAALPPLIFNPPSRPPA
jgi:hypothetical protein